MSLLYSPSIKYADGELRKNHPAEFMVDSNIYHQREQEMQQQNQQNQHNSGLVRYRSAPSSLLASLVDCSSNGGGGGTVGCEDHRYLPSSSPEEATMLARFMSPCNDQMVFQAEQQVQALPNHTPVDRSFSFLNSVGLEDSMKAKMGAAGNRSILLRQSSSPPELFSELTLDNGIVAHLFSCIYVFVMLKKLWISQRKYSIGYYDLCSFINFP